MAQEELVYISGETYYFNTDGSMMANGWVGFDKDSDVLYDYDLDIDENIDDIRNKVFKNVEDAYETVWMYFYTDGTAADDEWYMADSGLWYRFDDIVMVCGDYDHEIGNKRYGFAEDGHMFVGWEQNYVDKGITAPNDSSKSWYYYNSDGTKFNADVDNNGYGWKKIDGKWYCFKAAGKESEQQYSAGTLITKTFFTNKEAAGGNGEYYYVDGNGVMATGVTTIDKGAKLVDKEADWADSKSKVSTKVDANWDVYFNNDGKAQSDKWSGPRFYANAGSSKVMMLGLERDAEFELTEYKECTAASGYDADDKVAADIKGALVKNAFITETNDTYYVDKYGDKVTSSAIQVGFVSAVKTRENGKDVYTVYSASNSEDICTTEDDAETVIRNAVADAEKAVADAQKVVDAAGANVSDTQKKALEDAKVELAKAESAIVCKAYVVVNGKGIAYDDDDVDAGRTVSAGSKKYVATGDDYLDNAQLFYYYNKN